MKCARSSWRYLLHSRKYRSGPATWPQRISTSSSPPFIHFPVATLRRTHFNPGSTTLVASASPVGIFKTRPAIYRPSQHQVDSLTRRLNRQYCHRVHWSRSNPPQSFRISSLTPFAASAGSDAMMNKKAILLFAAAFLAVGASAQSPPPPARVYPTNNTWNGCLTQL